jgi:transcriptional regulator with XRE-family HTH domain
MFDPQVKQLADLGTRLRLARLRRKYTAATVAARAGITRVTLGKIERGIPGTSLGAYLSVLRALGLQADINAIARDDEMGRRLQDLELPEPRSRAPKTITARDSAPPLKPDLREGAP